MANTFTDNVWVVDTTGALNTVMHTIAIKLVAAGANATLTLKSDASNGGTVIYSSATNAGTEKTEYIEIRDALGFYATITGAGATAYVYQLARSSYQYYPGFYSPTFTGPPTFSNLTATTVPYIDASKILTSSAVTPTQLGYLSGTTGTTGTGNLVLSATPTFTGTATAPNVCATTKLEVGYAAAATTPGSCVKKVEIFDASGVSLGFLPVYSAIT